MPDDETLSSLGRALSISVQDLRGRAFAALLPTADPLRTMPVVARLEDSALVSLDGASPWIAAAPFVIEIGADRWAHHGLHLGDHVGVDPSVPMNVGKLFLVRWDGRYDLSRLQVSGTKPLFAANGGEVPPGSEGLDVFGSVVWHMRRM